MATVTLGHSLNSTSGETLATQTITPSVDLWLSSVGMYNASGAAGSWGARVYRVSDQATLYAGTPATRAAGWADESLSPSVLLKAGVEYRVGAHLPSAFNVGLGTSVGAFPHGHGTSPTDLSVGMAYRSGSDAYPTIAATDQHEYGFRYGVSVANTPPDAPTLTAPTAGATIDRTIDQTFTWTHSDPDGDAQAAYELQHRPVGGAWTLVSGTTSESHTFPGGTFPAGDYEWQVRTSDGTAYGAWSTTGTFTAATPPSDPTITDPTGGQRIDAPNYTATYTVTGTYTDSEWRTVADSAGSPDGTTVYWVSGSTGIATSTVVPFATDGRYEHLQVRVYNAGWWSQWASVRVLVSHLKQGSATGGFAFSNSATGDTPPNTGSATSGYAFTATASGDTPPNTGAAVSGVSWVASASGTNGQGGSAVTTYSFTTAAVGERAPQGSAVSGFAFTSSAVGSGKPSGRAVTTYRYTTSAVGETIQFMFTPPVRKVRASMSAPKPFRFYGVTVSSSVIFRNGHFQEVRSPEADEVDGLMEGVSWFPGGRTHEVDNDTKLLLEADGFTVDSV